MDGSLKEDAKSPADYAYNVNITREVTSARPHGRRVGRGRARRARLARVRPRRGRRTGTASKASSTATMLLTDPDEAMRFVAEDEGRRARHRDGHEPRRLQVHAQADGDVLAMDVIEKIHAKLPNTHLVMHGSSSVPQEWQEVFNANGGEMRRPMACRSRRSCAASSTVSARSTSTPICASPAQPSSVASPTRAAASSIRASS
jgi:fructose-bisphosphate aldolase class II